VPTPDVDEADDVDESRQKLDSAEELQLWINVEGKVC
jgi:hypothetical protein